MNKVVLIGRISTDIELKFIPGNGTAVATFNMAINRRFKKEGQPEADFVPIVIWGKIAEATATHMKKGRNISIAGRINTRNYEAKDGSGKRYITEIVAEEVDFIDWGGNKKGNAAETFANDFGGDATPIDDGDIPF
ncbi:MAG: single-strand DNA-binding protein [Clostridium sp.]|jgi:single-strand DNA-binding protein